MVRADEPPCPRANILLVDDRPANLLALEAVLDDLGQNLVRAGSGEEALSALLDDDFAVVLLDIQMHGLNGFETARRVREQPRSRHTPIIFLTAYDDPEFPAARAYTLGAVDYLVKPIVGEIVRAKVAVFVELFQKARQLERQAEQLRLAQQEQAERRALGHYTAAGLLAEAASLSEALPRLLRVVGESLGWDVAVLWLVDRSRPSLHCVEFWHTPALDVGAFETAGRNQQVAPGVGLPGRVLANGEPCWIADITQDASFPRAESAAQVGLHTGCALPIQLGPTTLGVLEFFSRDVRSLDEDQLRSLRAIANQVGQFLDRQQAAEALHQGAERLRLAVEATELGTWDFDPISGVLTWSDRCKAIFGLPADAPVSYPVFLDRLHPEDRDPTDRAAQQSLDPETPAEFDREYRACWPDGTIRWIRAKGRAFFDEVGERYQAVRFIGTVLDITERKQGEEALREADRRKDEFLAMLAHELRNPLAPIRNAAQVIRMLAPTDPNLQWARDVIDRQVKHLSRLVDDLLDVSRITRGKIQLHKAVVELSAVVAGAIETSRPVIEARRHHLHVSLPREPVRLDADPTRLAQVIANLLNNSAKYTEEEGQIWLTAAVEGDRAVVRVRDTGIGIPPTMLANVFDLFTQIDSSLDRAHGGLGIGLTLVRDLVALHGGTVHAGSDGLGRGSEFTVRLPALPPTSRRDKETTHLRLPKSLLKPARRVLIVDDNVDSAESIALLLKIAGHEVRTAHTGPGGMEEARTYRPEVVLLDIGLPGMSGYEVARQLRRETAGAQALLVAMTGYGQDEDRRRTREAGFDHHLVKPVDPDELERILAVTVR